MTKKEWELRRYEKSKLAYAALMKFYPLTLEDLPGEIWLPVVGYEDLYHVSNFGRLKSFKRSKPHILKPRISTDGYLRVALNKGNKQKDFKVYRLVAICFIPNPEEKPEVNHRDGNPLNNHVGNLEWCTRSENMRHAVDTGLSPLGEEHPKAKLTAEQVRFIRLNPDPLNTIELAEMFGVDSTTISQIQLGRRYKTAGGSIRQSKCPRVSDNIRAQIRAEYVFGSKEFGSRALAKKYGFTPTTILNIVKET